MFNAWIPGTGLVPLLLNLPINVFRLLFPLEIAIRGPLYILFFIYQLMLDYLLYKALSRQFKDHKDSKSMILCSAFLAFVAVGSFFEPDFGSWLRHEVTTFPILQALFFAKGTHLGTNTIVASKQHRFSMKTTYKQLSPTRE